MKNTGFPDFAGQLSSFTAREVDRYDFLVNLLDEKKLSYEVLRVQGSRHLLIRSPKRSFPTQAIKTYVAHYDRHSSSPGANDNSAAVLSLIELVGQFSGGLPANNQLLLTDKEEVDRKTGLKNQGAWHLADWLTKQHIDHWSFFHFDAFGRGDTLVLSTTAGKLMHKANAVSSEVRQKNKNQFERLGKKLTEGPFKKILAMPTPLSDDFSFAVQGFPSSLLTCLPYTEAKNFIENKITPLTWKLINSPQDEIATLTPNTSDMLKTAVKLLIKWELPRSRN
jgi:hypothetical protein